MTWKTSAVNAELNFGGVCLSEIAYICSSDREQISDSISMVPILNVKTNYCKKGNIYLICICVVGWRCEGAKLFPWVDMWKETNLVALVLVLSVSIWHPNLFSCIIWLKPIKTSKKPSEDKTCFCSGRINILKSIVWRMSGGFPVHVMEYFTVTFDIMYICVKWLRSDRSPV